MTLVLRLFAVVVLGLAVLGGLTIMSGQSKNQAADRTASELASNKLEQQATATEFKRISDEIVKEADAKQRAADTAYSRTPQAIQLEALRQEDLRALRRNGKPVPALVSP